MTTGSTLEIPVACTLTEREQRARRKAIRETIAMHLAVVEDLPDGHLLRFEPRPGMREAIEAFIALESQCCAFLRFALTEGEREHEWKLEVTGPEGSKAIVSGMLGQLDRGRAAAGAGRLRRLVPGLGVSAAALGGAVLVCCALPALLLLVGLGGAGSALAAAEGTPVWWAAVSVVAAASAVSWRAWRRRVALSTARSTSQDCGC